MSADSLEPEWLLAAAEDALEWISADLARARELGDEEALRKITRMVQRLVDITHGVGDDGIATLRREVITALFRGAEVGRPEELVETALAVHWPIRLSRIEGSPELRAAAEAFCFDGRGKHERRKRALRALFQKLTPQDGNSEETIKKAYDGARKAAETGQGDERD